MLNRPNGFLLMDVMVAGALLALWLTATLGMMMSLKTASVEVLQFGESLLAAQHDMAKMMAGVPVSGHHEASALGWGAERLVVSGNVQLEAWR